MKKKNNGLTIGILVGLFIALIVAICLYVFGMISFGGKNVGDIKIDVSKEYVYDAEYKYDNKYTEYVRTPGSEDRTIDYYGIPVFSSGKENLKNLKVPFINIDSDYAKTANAELEKIYLKYAEEFDSYAKENADVTAVSCSQILTYKAYEYNNTLSVVVIDAVSCTSPYIFNYHVYNFDLNDGSKISYDNMVSRLGYNKKTVFDKVKDSIKNKMDNLMSNDADLDLSTACHYSTGDDGKPAYGTTNCYDITYKLLQDSITDGSVLYLTDTDGNLNLLPILYFDFFQNGSSNHYLIKVIK